MTEEDGKSGDQRAGSGSRKLKLTSKYMEKLHKIDIVATIYKNIHSKRLTQDYSWEATLPALRSLGFCFSLTDVTEFTNYTYTERELEI